VPIGGTIQLAGRNHVPGSVVAIAWDGQVIQRATVGPNGRFSAVRAPEGPGIHRLTVVEPNGQVIDGAMVLIRPQDRPEAGERDRRPGERPSGGARER
jgi:hypothetical protein